MSDELAILRTTMIFLLACLSILAVGTSRKICIDNVGNCCSNCDINATTQDLSEVLDNTATADVAEVTMCSMEISLEDMIVFQNRNSILMKCFDYMRVCTLFCRNGQHFGLEFRNVSNVTLQNLEIEECGEFRSLNGAGRSSLYMHNCLNIEVMNVNIRRGHGTGLRIIDSSGFVLIENCTFEGNTINNSVSGGGGLYIEFTYCDQSCSEDKNMFLRNGRYVIKGCTFRDNIASTVEEKLNFRASESHIQGYGRGGGVCILIRGYAENNTFDIKNCRFINNSAVWGGGLYITLRDSPKLNTISVSNTDFENNSCRLNGGGAVSVGLLFFEDNEPTLNKIRFSECKYCRNIAEHGGGTLIYSSLEEDFNKSKNELSFEHCEWSENSAKFGAAVGVTRNAWSMLYNGYSLSSVFKNCSFYCNHIDNSLVTYHHSIEGKGAFLVIKSDVIFEGDTYFYGNSDTGLYLVSSNAIFRPKCHATFMNNMGRVGGAIVILGFGSLQINDNTTFDFTNNSAREKGGAIYQQSQSIYDYFASRSCFILYVGEKNRTNERGISFTFKNNRAGNRNEKKLAHLGQSIYAGTLHPCFTSCQQSNLSDLTYNKTFDCIAKFVFEKRSMYDISSAGENLTIDSQNSSLYPIPGESVKLPITLKDDLNNEVSALYHLFIFNQSHNSTIVIANDDNYVTDKWVQFFGTPGHSATLKVETEEDVWEVTFKLQVHMMECPPGYYLRTVTANDQNRTSCECLAHAQTRQYLGVIASCNNSDYTAKIRTIYWIGYQGGSNREEYRITSYCPPGYCVEKETVTLPKSATPEYLTGLICKKRVGKLCGKCRESYSSYFHSNSIDCHPGKDCDYGPLLFLISEILPTTIFFAGIVILDVSFTDGAINALVFYFQMTVLFIQRSSSYVRCPSPIPDLLETYQLIVGVFNLKFFSHKNLSFCLWPKAQTLDLQAFRYVTIIYSLLLVILIVVILRFCNFRKMMPRVLRMHRARDISIQSTIIHSLSGFLVICYSECTKISLLLLTPVTVHTSNGTYTAVFYNGELKYFEGKHLAYAIPALFFFIILGLIPPLLLVSYPLCYRIFGIFGISESKLVTLLCKIIPLERFKPFFDSFQSSFKDEYRFFSGLYFLYRLFILLTFSIARSYTIYYLVMIIGLTFILCFHAAMQPYRARYHNVLDSFIFLNLIMLEALNFYKYRRALEATDRTETVYEACKAETAFLYLPLIYFAAVIVVKILKKTKCRWRKERNTSHDQELSESLLFGRKHSV